MKTQIINESVKQNVKLSIDANKNLCDGLQTITDTYRQTQVFTAVYEKSVMENYELYLINEFNLLQSHKSNERHFKTLLYKRSIIKWQNVNKMKTLIVNTSKGKSLKRSIDACLLFFSIINVIVIQHLPKVLYTFSCFSMLLHYCILFVVFLYAFIPFVKTVFTNENTFVLSQ